MTDEDLRILEREALSGNRDALERLVAERARQEAALPVGCWVCGKDIDRAAWPDHHAKCGVTRKRAPEQAPEVAGGPMPLGVPIAARPYKEPLWSRVVLEPGAADVAFFLGDAATTNLDSPSPGFSALPRNQHFYAFGAALVPDAGSDPGSVMQAWNEGVLRLRISSLKSYEWPARLVMTDPRRHPVEIGDATFGLSHPRAMLTIKGKPYELCALERFDCGLSMPSGAISKPLSLMFVLYGIRLRGITS